MQEVIEKLNGLYKFEVDFGRMGIISGAFIAKKEEVKSLMGKTIYLDDALGKHSDIDITLERSYFKLICDDPFVVSYLQQTNGSKNIAGYNPLDYIE